MNEEEMITTYKEFEESIKNGDSKPVKGLGRLLTYQSLEYIKELLENNYSEELEDSFVAISSYIDNKEKENKQLQNNWNELKKWLIQLQKFKGINQQGFSWGVAQEVLDKMKEMEKGKDENNK